jgi:hypothetical protein
MLRIREEQMEHLGKRTRRRFLEMLETYLREHFRAKVASVSDADLRAWLTHALGKAEEYGVTTEPEAAQLILLFAVLGVDADERLPWVKETLGDRGLAAIGKVKLLIARARENAVPDIDHVIVYRGMEA